MISKEGDKMIWEILKEDIKNTRFLLTIIILFSCILALLLIFGLAVISIIYGVVLDQVYMVLIASSVGGLFALLPIAANWYFDNRKTAELARIQKEE